MPIIKRVLSSPPEVISQRISDTREARGISASELARLVGVTPTAVWNWEKNRTTPRRPALEQIAKVLGVTIGFLLTGTTGDGEIGHTQAPEVLTTESVAAI